MTSPLDFNMDADMELMQTRINTAFKYFDRLTEWMGLNVEPIVNADRLRQLPPGSFGRIWIEHLDERQLEPFTEGSRRKQLHDGIHTLTGYDTDPAGEAELQAFLMGAHWHVLNGLVLLGFFQSIYWRHCSFERRSDIRQRLWQAYQRGCHCTFNPATWQPEELWHLPLDDVRHLYSLRAIANGVPSSQL